jgi:hypothetical protein
MLYAKIVIECDNPKPPAPFAVGQQLFPSDLIAKWIALFPGRVARLFSSPCTAHLARGRRNWIVEQLVKSLRNIIRGSANFAQSVRG